MKRAETIEVLKKRIQNLIVSDLISPLWWEDFADELQAKELSDEEALEANADLLMKRQIKGENMEPVSYTMGFQDCHKWYRDNIKQQP